MFDRYSMRARRVIFLALWIAQKRGAAFIELEDILEAVIREDQGEVSAALAMHPDNVHIIEPVDQHPSFFTPEIAGRLLAAFEVPPQGPAVPTHQDMPLSDPAKSTLKSAERITDDDAWAMITPLHLLAGILEQRESRWAQLLQENGITRQNVVEALRPPK
jgi:ATP-dependent Clp protease ATP-binding subunit ClpA